MKGSLPDRVLEVFERSVTTEFVTVDRGAHSGLVVHAWHVSKTHRVPGAELEPEEILERARQARPPLGRGDSRERCVVQEYAAG